MGRTLFALCAVAVLLPTNVGCKQEARPTADTPDIPKAEPAAAEPEAVQHVPDSRPIAVLLVGGGNAWFAPTVIIYEGGEIIYVKDKEQYPWHYYFTKRTPEEIGEMVAKWESFGDYSRVERGYNLVPNGCDIPGTAFFLAFGERDVVTEVIGLSPCVMIEMGESPKDILPGALRKIYQYLIDLNFDDARPWLPQEVDVTMTKSPSSASGGQPPQWPSDWPGPTSPDAEKSSVGFSLRLPGDQLPRLEDLLDGCNGVEVTISWNVCYVLDFPGEDVWENALWPGWHETPEGEAN